ncbi:MAG: response regulator [Rhodanobacteraceae bacterium]
MNVAGPRGGLSVSWPRVAGSVALAAAGVLATLWVAFPQVIALWGLLLVALALVWLVQVPQANPAQVSSAVPVQDPVDVALRTRLASAQSELTSLRGVQRELLAAKVAAEAAMLAKSEFLASMSHEIRTPLNGVLPLLDIVLGTDLSPAQREYLVTANASAKELLRIVDDILDYSKAEAGKLNLESVSINIRELVDSVKRLLEKPAEAKGLAMRAVVDPDVRPVVRGDPMRIRQILTNLMGNAIKFTQRGGVSVRISRRNETATQHELLFAVRDTGIGLAPDAAARLFHPFTQADASVTRRYGGTGLGLTICKKLVDLMGGKIGVRSEPGRGSVFWFSIPFEKMPGDIAGARREIAGLRTLLACSTRQAQRLTPMLAGLGLETTHIANAASALVRLRQAAPLGRTFGFELLVLDAGSVDGDATALLRNVLRDPKLASIRVLALGGAAENDPRIVSAPREVDDEALRNVLQEIYGLPARGRQKPLLGGAARPQVAASADRQLRGQVLLVEDHPVNQQVARRLLERLGLKVESAGNGAEALDKIKQQHFDLVLMDCQMPVLDGYSATRRLREREQAQTVPRMPVIAMTAHAMAGDRERCLEAGMDDYLTKPLDRTLLADTLARWLDLAGTPPAPPVKLAVRTAASASQSSTTGAAPSPAIAPATLRADATTVAAPDGVLDEATLDDLHEIMGDELRGLVAAYLHDGDQRLDALRVAADRNDAVEVGKLAHSLKSSSANLGAKPLAEAAKAVEHDARSGMLVHPSARVEVLEKLYAATSRALRQRFPV